jgi:hypothetical protein
MQIRDQEKAFLFILQCDPLIQCACQMSDMAWTGGAVAC